MTLFVYLIVTVDKEKIFQFGTGKSKLFRNMKVHLSTFYFFLFIIIFFID